MKTLDKDHPAYQQLARAQKSLRAADKALREAHKECCNDERGTAERLLASTIQDELQPIVDVARSIEAVLSCFNED